MYLMMKNVPYEIATQARNDTFYLRYNKYKCYLIAEYKDLAPFFCNPSLLHLEKGAWPLF